MGWFGAGFNYLRPVAHLSPAVPKLEVCIPRNDCGRFLWPHLDENRIPLSGRHRSRHGRYSLAHFVPVACGHSKAPRRILPSELPPLVDSKPRHTIFFRFGRQETPSAPHQLLNPSPPPSAPYPAPRRSRYSSTRRPRPFPSQPLRPKPCPLRHQQSTELRLRVPAKFGDWSGSEFPFPTQSALPAASRPQRRHRSAFARQSSRRSCKGERRNLPSPEFSLRPANPRCQGTMSAGRRSLRALPTPISPLRAPVVPREPLHLPCNILRYWAR